MYELYKSDIEFIKLLEEGQSGYINVNNSQKSAQLRFIDKQYRIEVATLIDLATDQHELTFHSKLGEIELITTITTHHNSVNVAEQTTTRSSGGFVDGFSTGKTNDQFTLHRAYYRLHRSKLLYDLTGAPYLLKITIHAVDCVVRQHQDFLIIQNETPIPERQFRELIYRILIAIGFISGEFLQDYHYVFHQTMARETTVCTFGSLRKGTTSMYRAVTTNPFGYSHLLGDQIAAELSNSDASKGIDSQTIARLTELLIASEQLQYALVLFNDTNGNDLSLLVKNNCFFVVIEVLLKYCRQVFAPTLPKDYEQRRGYVKFELAFSNLFAIVPDDVNLYGYRNKFFHGSIESISGSEMLEVMQKQISFIYKVVLSIAGFNGYIINHHALQNNNPTNVFVKLGIIEQQK